VPPPGGCPPAGVMRLLATSYSLSGFLGDATSSCEIANLYKEMRLVWGSMAFNSRCRRLGHAGFALAAMAFAVGLLNSCRSLCASMAAGDHEGNGTTYVAIN
jgi:hypothetical protein